MSEAVTSNPHWIGNYPAWDITLTNGDVHKDVTQKEIQFAINQLRNQGKLHHYSTYIDVVRKKHINWYNEYHVSNNNS